MEGHLVGKSSSSKAETKASFTSALTLTQSGLPHVPQRYVLPPSQRPNPSSSRLSTTLPIVDLSSLQSPSLRPQIINNIRMASKEIGFFQVVNHGIPSSVMEGALSAAKEFFNLPLEEKMLLGSDSVHAPVREKMGNYAKAVQVLQEQIMELVIESLGLNPKYLQEEVESGSQLVAVNCYPACPEPELALGMPPHSDYGSITILLQSCPGLQVKDQNSNWQSVPAIEGALLVQLGDQMEVLSNGHYKSVLHRATVSAEKTRLSIASLHSLSLDKKVGPAPMLVDKQHPESYKEFSFRDFLDFIANNDIVKGRFIDTLKQN
ncbi:hypothetical protein ACE6H2_007424 [Prunus campanulata]